MSEWSEGSAQMLDTRLLPVGGTPPVPLAGAFPNDPPALHVSLLGGFRIAAGQNVLEDRSWRLRKAAGIVKRLCLAPGHRLQRDQLLESLWPDLAPEPAANNLNYALYIARRTLEAAFPIAGRCLRTHAGLVELQPSGPLVVDVELFDEAAREADRSGDLATYTAAIQHYAGDLLPDDRYEDWAAARREHLRDRYQALLLDKARLHEQRGEFAAAVQSLTLALANQPASEEAHAALIRLYALGGQRHQALRQYQHLCDALRREFDADPDPATQRLYQDVLAGRLAAAAPPRASPAAAAVPAPLFHPRHNIPSPLTSFFGRQREMAELPDLLAQKRLVTLAGSGGCGKTRLALEVAPALSDRAADGVWLVELAPLTDGNLIPQAVASMLGVVEEPSRPLVETLCQYLSQRQIVLVLDNCEHVVAEAAAFAHSILRAAPTVRVLATSREPLGIAGEVIWRVPSLGLPDFGDDASLATLDELEASEAVQLFVDRARLVQPTFGLDEHNARTVAQICRRLDGLPLAIELAAARVAAVALPQIVARLDDCFRLLTTGGRTAPARHQTLRAAVDSSYVLLAQPERTLFNRLAVFGGTFTLDAAERICAEDDAGHDDEDNHDVLTLLAHLVNKSLVVTDGKELRYRLLEPLRQYAAERLSKTGDAGKTHRRHAGYFAGLAEASESALTGPDQVGWLDRLDAEHDNLRAALRWSLAAPDAADAILGMRTAAALARFWHVRSHLEEGLRWLETAVTRSTGLAGLEGVLRARLLEEAGSLASVRAEYARAAALHEEGLRLWREADDARGTGWSLISLGNLAYAQRDYTTAGPCYEEALDCHRRAADQRGIATALGNLGYVARNQGNYQYAEALCLQSLRVYEALGDRRCIALSLAALGFVADGRGHHAAAAAYYGQSLSHARALGARRDMATALEGLATALSALDRAEPAAVLFGGAQALRGASGAPRSDADQVEYDRALSAVHAALDTPSFRAAWQRGASLSLDFLIDFALSIHPPATPPSLGTAQVTAAHQ